MGVMEGLDPDTLMIDPDTLWDCLTRFPRVEWLFVAFVDLDACSGCPTHVACDPLESVAEISYRRWNTDAERYGHTYKQPVGGCCLAQELADIFRNGPAEVCVRVLQFDTKAVA
jgi:hypothetical protein